MKVVGFTGTRVGMTNAQRETLSHLLREDQITMAVHGGCEGADWNFHGLVLDTPHAEQITIAVYPSTLTHSYPPPILDAVQRGELLQHVWNRLGASIVYSPQAPLTRNRQMVQLVRRYDGIYYATPKSELEELRSGTWATIRAALKCKVQLKVIYPNGVVG